MKTFYKEQLIFENLNNHFIGYLFSVNLIIIKQGMEQKKKQKIRMGKK